MEELSTVAEGAIPHSESSYEGGAGEVSHTLSSMAATQALTLQHLAQSSNTADDEYATDEEETKLPFEVLHSNEDDASWEGHFNVLKAYKEQHGNLNVPASHELYPWIRLQREKLRAGNLGDNRWKLLNAVGFTWFISTWQERFNELKEFYETHGHCNIPSKHPLYHWTLRQRWHRKSGKLNEDKRQALDTLMFDWRMNPLASSEELTGGSQDQSFMQTTELSGTVHIPDEEEEPQKKKQRKVKEDRNRSSLDALVGDTDATMVPTDHTLNPTSSSDQISSPAPLKGRPTRSFRECAFLVLQKLGKPSSVDEITKKSLSANLLITASKSPRNSFASMFHAELKDPNSVFVKIAPGIFGLKDYSVSIESLLRTPSKSDLKADLMSSPMMGESGLPMMGSPTDPNAPSKSPRSCSKAAAIGFDPAVLQEAIKELGGKATTNDIADWIQNHKPQFINFFGNRKALKLSITGILSSKSYTGLFGKEMGQNDSDSPVTLWFIKNKAEASDHPIQFRTDIERDQPTPHHVNGPRPKTFIECAFAVLKKAGRPLPVVQILAESVREGLLSTNSKSPRLTMAGALSTEVKKPSSVFIKVDKGLYGLRDYSITGDSLSEIRSFSDGSVEPRRLYKVERKFPDITESNETEVTIEIIKEALLALGGRASAFGVIDYVIVHRPEVVNQCGFTNLKDSVFKLLTSSNNSEIFTKQTMRSAADGIEISVWSLRSEDDSIEESAELLEAVAEQSAILQEQQLQEQQLQEQHLQQLQEQQLQDLQNIHDNSEVVMEGFQATSETNS